MNSEASIQSLARLRDGSHVSWMVVPMLLVVIYVYAQEIERGNIRRIFAALAFWGMDWFNEIWNGLVFHFTQFAPVWGIAGDSSYLILMGLNIEIAFMFAITGIVATLGLPRVSSAVCNLLPPTSARPARTASTSAMPPATVLGSLPRPTRPAAPRSAS